MPHVGPLKDEEGAKCAKQQSPTEEKQERGKLYILLHGDLAGDLADDT